MAKAASLMALFPSTTSPCSVAKNQIRDANVCEVHAERIHPKVVFPLGIASCDVPRYAFAKPKFARKFGMRSAVVCGADALRKGLENRRFGRLGEFNWEQ